MKTKNINPRVAFTLVELLVVIAIISIVATCLAKAVKGGIRQANSAKCLANLKNLHNATLGFLADNTSYPHATSWEKWWPSGNGDSWEERRGWVSWLPGTESKNGGSRRDDNGLTVWNRKPGETHAAEFFYPRAVVAKSEKKDAHRMQEAIAEGSLFKLVKKDYSTYVCPEHARNAKDKSKVAYLSYAMNKFFRGDVDVLGIVGSKRDPSRLVLFVELDEDDVLGDGNGGSKDRQGVPDTETSDPFKDRRIYPDDCCWDWNGDEEGKSKELGRFSHSKGGGGGSDADRKKMRKYKVLGNHSHVVFLDGHVGSVAFADFKADGELFEKLGNGAD